MTYVAKGEEEKLFNKMEETIGVTIDTLPGITNWKKKCLGSRLEHAVSYDLES